MAHSIQVVFACEDPEKLATFWAGALDYVLQPPPPGFATWEAFARELSIPEDKWGDVSAAVDPEARGPRLFFERYDGGQPNQRVHIDVNSVGAGEELTNEERRSRLAKERMRLEAFGATYKREASGMAGETWIEMFDPEGNWFCVQ
ncbi:MAG: VOC family protein [Acidimicrobiia bacterium]